MANKSKLRYTTVALIDPNDIKNIVFNSREQARMFCNDLLTHINNPIESKVFIDINGEMVKVSWGVNNG